MSTKRWTRSWVLWVNFLSVMAAGALELAPGLKGVVPDKTYAWAMFGLGMVNMALRFKTTSALTVRKERQP